VNGCPDDIVLAYPALKPLGALFRGLLRANLSLGTVVITVTEGLQKWIRDQAAGKPVFVVPNGADTELFRPGARNGSTVDGDYVAFVGTLARWQGIDTMLHVIERPDWPAGLKLVIAGDGPERARVEEAAGRTSRIVYLGRRPQSEIPGILAASVASLSVQNNRLHRSEKGLCPLKVFETMACGVPVIVSDFPGQADLIRENHCGLVVPEEDPAALMQAIAFLYANPDTRHDMGRRGRDLAVEHCSWEQRARAVDRILRSSRAA
jgi:glycosyltransferase involved in cell wall biosynthesis